MLPQQRQGVEVGACCCPNVDPYSCSPLIHRIRHFCQARNLDRARAPDLDLECACDSVDRMADFRLQYICILAMHRCVKYLNINRKWYEFHCLVDLLFEHSSDQQHQFNLTAVCSTFVLAICARFDLICARF